MFSSSAVQQMTKSPGDGRVFVDLKLDERLEPTPIAEYNSKAPRLSSSQELANSFGDGKTYTIGSAQSDDRIFYPGDLGLFGCVFEAWKNHWNLRTCPEDWWMPVAMKIAKAVDAATKPRMYGSDKVRELFVSHKGKETISVEVPVHTIYQVDYDFLFSAFSEKIGDKIKVPEFAQFMQNDFGSSGPAHKIASQINLMSSLQEFFEYQMFCCGCGLKGLEMAGGVEDWEGLAIKLVAVRKTLEPIKKYLRLSDGWWDHALNVYQNLANTRKNPEDPTVAQFWINVLMDTTGTKYVGGGGSMPGKPVEVAAYNGWLVPFLTDGDKILAEHLNQDGAKGSEDVRKQLSGWNQVPMKISLTWCKPPLEDESTLVAGMVGFKVHDGEESGNEETTAVVPSVEPHHMWAMMLPPQSKLRG